MRASTLTVGVPREIKPKEKRVGLTPQGARFLSEKGIRVLVEQGAGEPSGFSNDDYRAAGAEILKSQEAVYQQAGLIKKVKEPLPPEWKFLKPGLVVFCYFHLASPENRKLVERLCESKTIAIGLETVEKDGRTILLEPMSEIAGVLAAYYAGFFKNYVHLDRGKIVYPPRFLEKLERLAMSFPEVPETLRPGRAVIFGGGTVGRKALEMLLQMGGEVEVIEKRAERRQMLAEEFMGYRSRFRSWSLEESFQERLIEADVWMGCVHVAGKRAPLVLSEEDLRKFSGERPKLILDIAVDQGGNFPGTHSTTYEDPLYLDPYGNLRFGVANIPSLCGRGASEAIEKATLQYTFELAQDWENALRKFPELGSGVQVKDGELTNEAVALAHGLSWEALR
jgi:alanine dehydrogenase